MANVREIRNRIKSVQNIQQITRAMKMIAAARIKRVERMLRSRRPYCEKLYEIIGEIIAQIPSREQAEGEIHPLMTVREKRTKTGLLVVTGDKGLCGAYNMNVIRRAERLLRSISEENKLAVIYVVGMKAYRYILRKGYAIEKFYAPWEPRETLAEDLASMLSSDYVNGKFDELHCVYTRSISLLAQSVTVEQFFPIRKEEAPQYPKQFFLIEPEPGKALDVILPMFVREDLMRVLLDAKTAELSSRVNAMANATENAEKLVGELRLNYFRARQESITTEILEIVSGAEVMHRA